MAKSGSIAQIVVRWPVLYGGVAALAFYTAIHKSGTENELIYRYFCSHPVEYISMAMFFTGLAALAIKAISVSAQSAELPSITLGPKAPGGDPLEKAGPMIEHLAGGQSGGPESYLVRRLRESLEYIQRKGSAESLDDQLRFAGDMDAVRVHGSYALVRIIIWAIPILGFLGTVMGLTLAIAELGPQDLEKSMPAVIYGLKIAFDTTALALGLSIVLMFAQFIVDKFESRLLARVDERANEELVGRFQEYGAASDPQAASVRRMAESVLQACDRLVERQTELWRGSMEAAQQQWQQTVAHGGRQLTDSLQGALKQGLSEHANALAVAEQTAAQQARQHWQEMHTSVQRSAEVLTRQQDEMSRQAVLLLKSLESVDQIRQLETALNHNLDALANEHNFEETILSLSAAIQLMTAQLHGGAITRRKESKTLKVDSNAA